MFFARTVALCLAVAGLCGAETYLAAPFANRSGEAGLDWIGESVGETVRAALDQLHVESGVSLQLFVLHECGRVRTQVERAAGRTGVGGNGRLGGAVSTEFVVGDRR